MPLSLGIYKAPFQHSFYFSSYTMKWLDHHLSYVSTILQMQHKISKNGTIFFHSLFSIEMMTRTFKNSARKVMANFRAYQVPISYFGLSHEINNFPHSEKIVYACCTKVIKKVAQERDKESFKSGLQMSDEIV